MLCYKRINTHFYMDTFFTTRKVKLYRGNTCIQSFVSDTGFIYVYPMKNKLEISDAVKAFAKEIGAYITDLWSQGDTEVGNKSCARRLKRWGVC